MFRKIGKWLNGDTILAEVIGIAGRKVTAGLLGKNRSTRALVEKILSNFDADETNNSKLF